MIMEVDPPDKTDDVMLALATNARHLIDDLIGYVDVLPPKLPLGHIHSLQSASKLLSAIGASATLPDSAQPE